MLSSQRKIGDDFANGAALGRRMGKRAGKRHMKGDKDEGFVDIVARGGQEWIRMYRWVRSADCFGQREPCVGALGGNADFTV